MNIIHVSHELSSPAVPSRTHETCISFWSTADIRINCHWKIVLQTPASVDTWFDCVGGKLEETLLNIQKSAAPFVGFPYILTCSPGWVYLN